MLPDTIPSPKAAEPFEARLRGFTLPNPPDSLDARITVMAAAEPDEASLLRFDLPEPSAALDARMQALFAHMAAQSAPAAHRRPRSFWRRTGAFAAAAAGLAACAALALLLRPAAPAATPPAGPIAVVTPADPAPAGTTLSPRLSEPLVTVPVGYEYQGSRMVYARETPVGTLTAGSGTPMQAIRRDSLERHLYRDPKTQATLEVDTPREDVILENIASY